MIRRIVIILFSILLLLSFLNLPAVFSQESRNADEGKPASGAPAAAAVAPPSGAAVAAESAGGMDALVNLLKDKGVLSAEDAAAFKEKRGKAPAQAADVEALVLLLSEKGVISKNEAAVFSERFTKKAIEAQEKQTFDRISENVAKELRKEQEQLKVELSQEINRDMRREIADNKAPEWTERIRFGGDVRLRYQGEYYGKNNAAFLKPSNPTELLNSTEDRNRFLLRGRLGLTAQVTDEVEAAVRITTGSTSNPVSTNTAMGDYENNKAIVLDLAYIRWNPVPDLSLWGGRMPNPFFYTDMVWDQDLNFDGIGVSYTHDFNNRYALFANALASPLQEVEMSNRDKWLFGAQLGFQYKPRVDLTYKIAAAYYDYKNVTGEANDPLRPGEKDFTAPQFQQKGNTLFDIDPSSALKLALASDYKLVNLTGNIEIAFWQPVYITFWGDYVKNIGFDRNEVARRTGNPDVKEETEGYQVGITVGHKRFQEFGDWELFLFYKRLEADAVLDAFTDSDFHGGGTNAKGWILGGSLGLAKNVWMRARWFSTDEISGPPFAVDMLQLDLNAKF